MCMRVHALRRPATAPNAASAPRLRCHCAQRAMAAPPVYQTVEDTVGNTPLVRLQRLGHAQFAAPRGNTILLKLEGNNPAGSVKDRPALSMIQEAERAGRIKPGDTLIEATSGARTRCVACVRACMRLAASRVSTACSHARCAPRWPPPLNGLAARPVCGPRPPCAHALHAVATPHLPMQHGHRARDGGRNQGVQDAPHHARQHVRRTPPVHVRLRYGQLRRVHIRDHCPDAKRLAAGPQARS